MCLQASLGMDVIRLEKELIHPSRSHGISTIPNEIMEKIIIAASAYGSDTLCRLSMVSKRFRWIIENSSTVLGDIDTRAELDELRHRCNMSTGSNLAVTLNIDRWSQPERPVLELLAGRISDFSYLHLHGYRDKVADLERIFSSDQGTTTFSSAKTLILSDRISVSPRWRFPNLTHLRRRNCAQRCKFLAIAGTSSPTSRTSNYATTLPMFLI